MVSSPDRAGSPARIIVLNNVTPARSLESVMRLLDRWASIGTLSASMAHELKNAMVAVKTFTDVLLKKNQDAELARLVGREIKRIDSIVSQMMRFSGPAKPTFSAIHVHDVLEQALALIKHRLEAKQVQLIKSFKASRDVVKGDAYQLEQTFINLFSNAVEAMGPEGELHVHTHVLEGAFVVPETTLPTQSLIQVDVRDTGVGVPSENLQRLFEPFFTTKVNGTGLGLAITRRIIEEHRGKIAVESALNDGTVFNVTLPLLDRLPPGAKPLCSP
jgi:signal transduction histidine kinase